MSSSDKNTYIPKWEDTEPVETSSSGPSWDETEEIKPVSKLESLARGAGQGLSFGFADELTGAIESALTDKDYEIARNESRANYEEAQRQNPGSYMTGEIGGAIGTSFVPGMGILNAGKGAGLASKLGLGAAQGGVSALGLSKADNIEDLTKDALQGAAIGGVVTGAGEAISKGFQKLKPLVSKGIDKLDDAADNYLVKKAKTTINMSEDEARNYLANSKRINNAPTDEQMLENYFVAKDNADQLSSKVSSQARDQLDNEVYFDKTKITDDIDGLKKDILSNRNKFWNSGLTEGEISTRLSKAKAPVGVKKEMIGAIDSELGSIKEAFDDVIDEVSLRGIIDDIDKKAYALDSSPKTTAQGEALRMLRGKLGKILDDANYHYSNRMEDAHSIAEDLSKVNKQFQTIADPDNSDKAIRAIKRLKSDKLPDSSSLMEASNSLRNLDDQAVGGPFATDLRQQARDRSILDKFGVDATRGSRNVLKSAVVGGAVGELASSMFGLPGFSSIVGAGVNAIRGHNSDRLGGLALKGAMDAKIALFNNPAKFIQNNIGRIPAKFVNTLTSAASRGNKSLAVTHFLLSQQNPEYREAMRKIEENEN